MSSTPSRTEAGAQPSDRPGSPLRPITDADVEAVLDLNQRFVHLLAPMDHARLEQLRAWSDRADVVQTDDGGFAGFVITVAAGSAYDSINYRWFEQRFGSDHYYLDRIVLDPDSRRAGLGARTYDVIEQRARQLAPRMCLEVNVDPPNEPSLAFHRRRGYVELERHEFEGHLSGLMVKEFTEGGSAR